VLQARRPEVDPLSVHISIYVCVMSVSISVMSEKGIERIQAPHPLRVQDPCFRL
jgi:hypothetical protein